MNLVILSQDKENLVKFNSNIGLHWQDKKRIIANYIDLGNGEYYDNLGCYETKERAKEVLNEIKELLKPKFNIEEIDDSVKIENMTYLVNPKYKKVEQPEIIVYEMPRC